MFLVEMFQRKTTMPAAVKAVALPEKLMTKHQNSPVRIGRHYSQDHLLGNHNSVLS